MDRQNIRDCRDETQNATQAHGAQGGCHNSLYRLIRLFGMCPGRALWQFCFRAFFIVLLAGGATVVYAGISEIDEDAYLTTLRTGCKTLWQQEDVKPGELSAAFDWVFTRIVSVTAAPSQERVDMYKTPSKKGEKIWKAPEQMSEPWIK